MRLRFLVLVPHFVTVPVRVAHPRSPDHRTSATIAILPALVALTAISACRSVPRSVVSPEATIAEAAQLPTSVEFRRLGPDGGTIDEPESGDGALSIGEAVRRAVTTDSGLQAALARVRVAAARADQARLLPNPVLGLVYRVGDGRPEFEASFVQEFVRALKRPTRARAADDRLRAAAADAVVVALDVVGDVQERYVDVQASAALLPLLEERLELVQRLVATSRARLEAGEGTRSDVVTLEAQHVELQVSIDRARLEERTNRLRLARRIGVPSAAATWTLDAWTTPDLPREPESEWIDAALASRPEIQTVEWKLAALGAEADLAELHAWDGASVGLDAQRNDGWQLGPSISTPLPVFDDGDAERVIRSAERIEARHEWTTAKRAVVEDVRIAYEALSASRANLARIQGELIPLQRQRRQLAEDAYRAGQTDVTPLFLAEQDLRVAETQAIEVEAQAVRALVRLHRAVGGPGVARALAARAMAERAADAATTTPVTTPNPSDVPVSESH